MDAVSEGNEMKGKNKKRGRSRWLAVVTCHRQASKWHGAKLARGSNLRVGVLRGIHKRGKMEREGGREKKKTAIII